MCRVRLPLSEAKYSHELQSYLDTYIPCYKFHTDISHACVVSGYVEHGK